MEVRRRLSEIKKRSTKNSDGVEARTGHMKLSRRTIPSSGVVSIGEVGW
jgi:hypothetical protein